MVQATLSRGGTSVDFQLEEESGGTPTIIQSISKPQQKIQPISKADPRVSDQFASVENFILRGYIDGDNAYEDARVLAEELIKPHSGGTGLTLDLSNADGFSSYTVVPSGESVCEIEYIPGQRDWLPISLNLPRVDTVVGGGASESINTSSATPQGGGSITLSNPDTGDSVDIIHNLEITRAIGRPNGTIRPDPSSVTYVDKIRPAVDEFQIRGVLTSDTARSDSDTLMSILSAKLGRDALNLEFNNNIYGLSDKTVVPTGSEAGRRVIGASEPGMVRVDSINLRVVTV